MAYTVADLPAQEQTDAAADRPMLMSKHALEEWRTQPAFRAQWRGSLTLATGQDDTDGGAPAFNAYDRFLGRPTRPAGSATSWAFCVDFGGANAEFDHVLIGGHNLGAIGSTTVELQIADDAAFTTNLITVATFTPGSTNARLVSLSLGTGGNPAPNVYSAVQFLRVLITRSPSALFTPQIGELVLGRRRQLRRRPTVPYDPDQQVSETADFVSRSGVTTRYVFNRGRAMITPVEVAFDTAQATPVTGWWSDINQGTRAFGWVERPGTAPTVAFWVLADPRSTFPYETDKIRRFAFSLVEQPPYAGLETAVVLVNVPPLAWHPTVADRAPAPRHALLEGGMAMRAGIVPQAGEDTLMGQRALYPDPVGGRWAKDPATLYQGYWRKRPQV